MGRPNSPAPFPAREGGDGQGHGSCLLPAAREGGDGQGPERHPSPGRGGAGRAVPPAPALRWLAAAALALLAAGCNSGQYPVDIFPEMHYQASQRRLEPERLAPPEEAVPFQGRARGPELYAPSAATAPEPAERGAGLQPPLSFAESATLRNPVPRAPEALERARQVFRVNCALCHGQDGHGQSVVAQHFAQAGFVPPVDLASPRVRARADGQLYWIVTHGLGNMPPFTNLLTVEERWTVVHLIREVQGP